MTTESDLWKRLRPQFIKAGALPIRLENAANLSVPDVAIIGRDATAWVELKVAKGNKVSIPKFQFACAVEMARVCNRNLMWLVVMVKGEVRVWRYVDIIEFVGEGNGEDVVLDLSKAPKPFPGVAWITCQLDYFLKERETTND